MADFVGTRKGTGQLRGPDEHEPVQDEAGRHVLDGEVLKNGDELELRLRGLRGWIPVTVEGLPDSLQVSWAADDGKVLRTSLSPGVGLRWP